MPYFATRVRCPKCLHVFTPCVTADAPPAPEERFRVRCPENDSPYAILGRMLRAVEQPPGGVVAALPWPPHPRGSEVRPT